MATFSRSDDLLRRSDVRNAPYSTRSGYQRAASRSEA